MNEDRMIRVFLKSDDTLVYYTRSENPEKLWLQLMEAASDYVHFGRFVVAKDNIKYIEVIR